MKELRLELGFEGVSCIPRTETLSRRSALAIGIAALDHEILDYPVKKCAVIETFPGKLEEIVAMDGSFVIETNGNVTASG